jgi:hypothetical protein
MSDKQAPAATDKSQAHQSFQIPEHSWLQDCAQTAWKMANDNLLTKIPGVKEAEQKLGIGAESAAPVLNAVAAESADKSANHDRNAQQQLDLGLAKSIY